ncbi:hypothetical protein ILYODFUR_014370 [Ilyodon furcidens]|uniref:Uncharacterized protein n=1 Tax=Ilyodon furcidens TaxID=33524 RepID=A0ABV0SL54_9TELE
MNAYFQGCFQVSLSQESSRNTMSLPQRWLFSHQQYNVCFLRGHRENTKAFSSVYKTHLTHEWQQACECAEGS